MTIASSAPAPGPGTADPADADHATARSTADPAPTLSLDARVILVALSAGAGVIHLVMAPIHAADSTLEAVLFAAVGWFQLACALAFALRPRRAWLAAAVVGNVVFIGAWTYSRTLGLPFGAHAGTAEAVGQVDTLTVVLQGLLVVTAAVLLARPAAIPSLSPAARVCASIVPAAMLVLTTLAIVNPTTAQHSHTTGSAAAPTPTPAQLVDAKRCDKSINPVSYWNETKIAGIDTIGPAALAAATPAGSTTPTTAADGHDHAHDGAAATTGTPPTTARPDPLQGRGSEKLDRVLTKVGSDSEVDAAVVVSQIADLSPAEYEAFLMYVGKNAANHTHTGSGDDTAGHGGHIGPNPWVAMTDPAQCQALNDEIAKARATALKYPTAADAQAAGYTRVTTYVPGIAAHWMKFSIVDDKFDVEQPEMLLYDGNGLDASIVGLSYYLIHPGDNEPTQGFVGDEDHSHRHIGLCVKGTLVVGDSTTTPEQCAALGGKKNDNQAGWMSHAWVVPGCESPWGVFSGANPLLDGTLPTHSGTDGGGCKGSGVRARYDLSPGQPAPATQAAAAGQNTQTASASGR